jgi:hypothetical protein
MNDLKSLKKNMDRTGVVMEVKAGKDAKVEKKSGMLMFLEKKLFNTFNKGVE